MRRIQILAVIAIATFHATTAASDPSENLERRRTPIVVPPADHGGLGTRVVESGDVVPITRPRENRRSNREPADQAPAAVQGGALAGMPAWTNGWISRSRD